MGLAMAETNNWEDGALCREVDPELFFSLSKADKAAAIGVCKACPVRKLCLKDALEFPIAEQHGVRGGLTARERRNLLNRRRLSGRYQPKRCYRFQMPRGAYIAGDYPEPRFQ